MNRIATVANRALGRLIAFAEWHASNAAFALAAFGLLVSCALPWIKTPLGRAPRGLQFGFLQELPALPHPHLASYGVIGLAIFVVTMIAGRFDRRAAFGGATALLALVLIAPLQIAFSHPAILRRLASEFLQQQNVGNFTADFLPVNTGGSPGTWTSLEFGTVWARLVSAWYFLTLGWYAFAVAAMIVYVRTLSFLQRPRTRAFGLSVVALLVLSAVFLAPAIAAHDRLDRAYLVQASGAPEEAIALYRATMRLDRWYALGPELYAQIGELHAALGRYDTPEYHLYRGQLFENQSVQPSVTYEYRLAARQGGGDLTAVGHQEAARVAASLGLKLYGARAFGGAIAQWQQAFEENPFELEALFYAARAHYEMAQYREAITAGEAFCNRTSDVVMMADVYSDMGDSYRKLNDYPRARWCYARSFKLDYTLNARGLGALAGN